ncbi:hypothetical protein ESA_04267 [Cronobacter sakazakii ATCC BAA-894]|uniref:Uncharacterized protein n=1 Tax=Cronobacter sakazakii (strain ATCC BAA-894) TaxID=290339 RepID=A7MHA1_CROS8|nr:hypothetical protein ESA_04267 [Cronobacter sakazakii ATCC BAA-894]
MIIFSLPELTLWSRLQSQGDCGRHFTARRGCLQIQRADNHKVAREIAGGGDGAVGSKALTVVAAEPDDRVQQQQHRADEAGEAGVGRAEEIELARKPHHYQRHADIGTNRPAEIAKARPDSRDQRRAYHQQRQRQRPEKGERHLAREPDGIEQVRQEKRPEGVQQLLARQQRQRITRERRHQACQHQIACRAGERRLPAEQQ